MTTRIAALTPSLSTAPGERAVGRVEIHNDGSVDAVYNVAVVGIEPSSIDEQAPAPPVSVVVPAGSSAVAEVPVVVPRSLGVGQHAAAFEVTSDRPTDRPALCPFTLSIASVARVDIEPQPATIRARRRAKFQVDLTNHEMEAVALTVDAAATDVDIRFGLDTFSLLPGQRATAKAKLKGPRQWTGEPTQHNIVITARGRASSTTATAAYVQRPLFAHKLRMAVAALTVIALWLGAIGGVAFWLANRDDGSQTSSELVGVDTDGDGVPDTFFDADGNPVTATDTDGDGIPDLFVDADGNPIPGTDTDGDGIPDTLVDANGNPIGAVDTDGDGVPDELSDGSGTGDSAGGAADEQADAPPTSTVLRGTVTAQGDPSGISIRMAPIELGSQPEAQAAALGFAGAGSTAEGGKLWSARYGRLDASTGPVRQTEAVPPLEATPDADGIWLFTDVAVRQTYELVFAKPGFDTQSFVVTPPEDGSPVDLDVELVPASGAVSGRITGPGGALGGVAIVVSDGTLTFETTSATDGDVGAWSLDGLSTPGVYTLTATQRGYGTEVLQINLDAGQQRTGVNLAMRPGVGSVSGRVVDETGRPLAGATVTATNGETVLSTSTLTEGAIGTYNLPQLDVPETYTIRVELDGYITQTRRVPLAGALPNVNFVMNRTTLELTGLVTSSEGGGIAGAAVIISTGDLTFRTITGVAPDAGSFTIDDLPPGVYSITFEHFEHETITEFVTLTAGVAPAPLTITMQATDGPPDVGTGSLVVTVVNNDPTVEPAGIAGATVTLTRKRSNSGPIVVRDASSANVRIDDLAVGTYTVQASHPEFNPSIPIQVSVGLNEERREIRLQELGQANGSVVDAVSKEALVGYSIQIWRVLPTGDVPVGGVIQSSGSTWETEPDTLATGLHRVEVVDVPRGYVVRNDQILDPAAGRPMQFIVPTLDSEAAVEPITITPIEADPLPEISGRIFVPQANGTDTPDFIAIDEPDTSLTVTAECNGNTVDNIKINDEAGTRGPEFLDEFLIPKADFDRAIRPLGAADATDVLPATCEITIDANGYRPLTFEVDGLVPSNGVTLSNRRVNTALVKPPPAISGTVFWTDDAEPKPVPVADRLPLDGVAIASVTNPIIGFLPAESTPTILNPTPGLDRAPVSTTSDSGAWTVGEQVFGVTDYTFIEPGFGDGVVRVEIDESGTPSMTALVGVLLANEGASFAIELEPPLPGTFSGRVTILTTTPASDADLVDVVTATPPTGPDVRPPVIAATGGFTVTDAAAGTWTTTFDPPDNHAFFGAAPTSVTERVGPFVPGEVFDGFDTTLVELGAVEVRITDAVTNANPSAGFNISGFGTATLPAAPPTDLDPADAPGYRIQELPVDSTDPENNDVAYTLEVLLDGYDLANARLGSALGPLVDARDLDFQLLAGETERIDLFIEPFGSIRGDLLGDVDGAFGTTTTPLALDTDPPSVPLPATLDVVRVRSTTVGTLPAWSEIEPGDDDYDPTAFSVGPGATDGSFVIIGPPGFYQLTPAHPQFALNASGIPSDPLGIVGQPPGVYRMRNGTTPNDIGEFVLDIRLGTLTIEAREYDGTATTGRYDMYRDATSCTGSPPGSPGGDIPTDGVDISNLLPGAYCIAITRSAPAAFPALFQITIPRDSDASPSVTSVVAPLPSVAPTIVGTVSARGENNGAAVELPAPADTPIVLQSSYTSDEILVNAGTSPTSSVVDNDNPDSGARSSSTALPLSPGDLVYRYSFDNVPYGSHEITAPTLPAQLGYTLVSTNPLSITVNSAGPNPAVEFVYEVADASVVFVLDDGLGGNDYPGFAGAKLVSPSGAEYTAHDFDDSTDRLVFTGVGAETPIAPQTWKLSFTDDLHADVVDQPVTIDLDIDVDTNDDSVADARNGGTVGTTADKLRLTGRVREQFKPGQYRPLAAGGKVELTGAATATFTGDGTTDGYSFDVGAGAYSFTAAQTNFPDVTTSFTAGPLGAIVAGPNLDLVQNAKVEVTVSPAVPALPLNLRLYPTGSNTASPALPTISGNVYTFSIPAGSYYAQASPAGYPTTRSDGTVSVAIGDGYESGTAAGQITLPLPRLIELTVLGATTATVDVYDATLTSEICTSGAQPTTSTFTFASDVACPGAIPESGALKLLVSAADRRPQVVDVPDAASATPAAVTLKELVTVTGTITTTSGTAVTTGTVKASDGSSDQPISGTFTATGYQVTGLTAGPNGASKQWTITYDEVGLGVATPVTVDVSGTSDTTVSGKNLTVNAQALTIVFDVKKPPNDTPLNGAVVEFIDSAGVRLAGAENIVWGTTSGGTITLSPSETLLPLTWRITAAGYVGQSGTIAKPAAGDPLDPDGLTPRTATVDRTLTAE